MDSKGQVSFNTLQRHRSDASSIRFYVFDLLIVAGRKHARRAIVETRDALTKLLRPISKKSSVIELSPNRGGTRQ